MYIKERLTPDRLYKQFDIFFSLQIADQRSPCSWAWRSSQQLFRLSIQNLPPQSPANNCWGATNPRPDLVKSIISKSCLSKLHKSLFLIFADSGEELNVDEVTEENLICAKAEPLHLLFSLQHCLIIWASTLLKTWIMVILALLDLGLVVFFVGIEVGRTGWSWSGRKMHYIQLNTL